MKLKELLKTVDKNIPINLFYDYHNGIYGGSTGRMWKENVVSEEHLNGTVILVDIDQDCDNDTLIIGIKEK